MALRIRLVGIAFIVIGIGWYGIWLRWASARKWEPLDMPVSLSPGHKRTPEFEINTRSSYRITFIARQGFGHQPGPSEPDYYQYCLPDLITSWSLSNRGQVVAKSAGQMCDSLGEFTAGSGRYVLDLHVLRDGSRFNAYGPRLAVYEVGGAQEASDNQGVLAFWSLVVLTTLGAGAVISSIIQIG